VYENDHFPEYCDDCKEELQEGSSDSGDVIFAESDPESSPSDSESQGSCVLEPVVGIFVIEDDKEKGTVEGSKKVD